MEILTRVGSKRIAWILPDTASLLSLPELDTLVNRAIDIQLLDVGSLCASDILFYGPKRQ